MADTMWGGRFSKTTDEMINEFQASIHFDKRMYKEDILGSITHAQMLSKVGILTNEEYEKIKKGLMDILARIEKGEFNFSVALEDIHMNIEKALTTDIGELGGKLHTARSRNDQVALDTHLYTRKEIVNIYGLIMDLQKSLLEMAEKNQDVIMPGYTHLQRAQPILFSHHLMAYFSMLSRDIKRLENVYYSTDFCPLGCGALAGTTFPIDRKFIKDKLNFQNIYTNSLDGVSDRDYIMEFLSFASILMVHLSRLSEEIILWCSREFSFVELDDAHCTGSSMMPQKKNPDVSELVRGKTGRVLGHLIAMLTVVKGTPLAYNKDFQEDKEGLFDVIDTVKFSLAVYSQLIRGMKVRKDNMLRAVEEDFSNATDLADYLVKKGMPFRVAHSVAGRAVQICIEENIYLKDLSLTRLQELSPLFEEDIFTAISPAECVKMRNSLGGTSFEQIKWQMRKAQEVLVAEDEVYKKYVEYQVEIK